MIEVKLQPKAKQKTTNNKKKTYKAQTDSVKTKRQQSQKGTHTQTTSAQTDGHTRKNNWKMDSGKRRNTNYGSTQTKERELLVRWRTNHTAKAMKSTDKKKLTHEDIHTRENQSSWRNGRPLTLWEDRNYGAKRDRWQKSGHGARKHTKNKWRQREMQITEWWYNKRLWNLNMDREHTNNRAKTMESIRMTKRASCRLHRQRQKHITHLAI